MMRRAVTVYLTDREVTLLQTAWAVVETDAKDQDPQPFALATLTACAVSLWAEARVQPLAEAVGEFFADLRAMCGNRESAAHSGADRGRGSGISRDLGADFRAGRTR